MKIIWDMEGVYQKLYTPIGGSMKNNVRSCNLHSGLNEPGLHKYIGFWRGIYKKIGKIWEGFEKKKDFSFVSSRFP